MKEIIREIIADIRKKTDGMTRKEKVCYLLNYYWHYALLSGGALALVIGIFVHILFPDPKPVFFLAIVNQPMDEERDMALQTSFSEFAQYSPKQVVVNSDYIFSYGKIQLENVNESSYEKFFFQWRYKQLGGVILPESFYQECVRLEAEFLPIQELCENNEVESFTIKDGVAIAIDNTKLDSYFMNCIEDPLYFVCPKETVQIEAMKLFLDFLRE